MCSEAMFERYAILQIQLMNLKYCRISLLLSTLEFLILIGQTLELHHVCRQVHRQQVWVLGQAL